MGISASLEKIKFSIKYRKDTFHYLFCSTKINYSTFSCKENSLDAIFTIYFIQVITDGLQKYFWCCYSSIGNKNINSTFDIQQIHRTRQKLNKSKYQDLCTQIYLYSMEYATVSWQRLKIAGFPNKSHLLYLVVYQRNTGMFLYHVYIKKEAVNLDYVWDVLVASSVLNLTIADNTTASIYTTLK